MRLKLTDRPPRTRRPVTPRKGSQPFTAAELQQIGSEITTQWFRPVETQCLTLMEIDPWNVYAYWNIAAAEIAAARTRLPGQGRDAALQLRFTDISPRRDGAAPHEQFAIEVQPDSNNWYVSLWRDARHYSAELGLRAADGTFVALARSNEVATPRATPSSEFDFRVREVRTPPPASAVHSPAARADNDSPASAPPASDCLLRDLYPRRLDPQDGFPLASQPLPIPPASLPEEPNGKVGAGETASPVAPPADTTVAGRPSVPLEAFLANPMFSPGHGNLPVNATAHILIAGQVAPATPLTLLGKPVALQEDGSFEVRLPLPRGPELAALLHFLRGRHDDRSEH